MALPNVNISLGNGNLGRINASTDGVAGMVLTGAAVADKLQLNKHYLLGSTREMTTLGIEAQANPLADKEIRAFYAQAGEGAELHIVIVAEATTLTHMCDPADGSPLGKLIDGAGGRIRIVGVNKIAPELYEADVEQGIDKDAITAAEKAQQTTLNYAKSIKPFRLLMPAPAFDKDCEALFKPRQSSYNRVAFVLASDDSTKNSAAIGMLLGRAAKVEPQQSIGRVKDGSMATTLNLTNGSSYLDMASMANLLHDAGYIIPIGYPTKNGAYLNGNPMAAPMTDDYSELNLGRIIDKATVVAYDTYISEILDNISVSTDGTLSPGVCVSFASMLENAVQSAMGTQISSFTVSINPNQNVLSTGVLEIQCKIVPLATLQEIKVNLAFENPALKS